jgi:hypothetical protein
VSAAEEATMQDTSTAATRSRDDGSVPARDVHPGDIVQQYDWPLHVREVTLSQATVLIAVTEFEFPLHYAADAPVRLTSA